MIIVSVVSTILKFDNKKDFINGKIKDVSSSELETVYLYGAKDKCLFGRSPNESRHYRRVPLLATQLVIQSGSLLSQSQSPHLSDERR